MDESKQMGLIDLSGYEDVKNDLKNECHNGDYITQFEFGKWMIEGKRQIKL